MIRDVRGEDADRITGIYNTYVTDTRITFEVEPVTADEVLSRIQHITANYPWLVYEEDGGVLGYTDATQWNSERLIAILLRQPFILIPNM